MPSFQYTSIEIPITNIRQSHDRLIFIIEITIPEIDRVFVSKRDPGRQLEFPYSLQFGSDK